MPKHRVQSGTARARQLAASGVALGQLLLAAAPALAGDTFWSRGRFDRFDAHLVALERETSLDSLPLALAHPAHARREATATRDSVVPRDVPIEFRVMGPLAEDGAAGLALEIRF